MKSTVS